MYSWSIPSISFTLMLNPSIFESLVMAMYISCTIDIHVQHTFIYTHGTYACTWQTCASVHAHDIHTQYIYMYMTYMWDTFTHTCARVVCEYSLNRANCIIHSRSRQYFILNCRLRKNTERRKQFFLSLKKRARFELMSVTTRRSSRLREKEDRKREKRASLRKFREPENDESSSSKESEMEESADEDGGKEPGAYFPDSVRKKDGLAVNNFTKVWVGILTGIIIILAPDLPANIG